MKMSESIKNLAMSIAKAQGAFANPVKNKKNPFLGNKCADLASV